ncbi:flavodoxin [Gottschalkiaceae bacterium SANA]|nr:flavodoxin [Gottschalkiaceae bacterium SANA]
MKKVTIIYGSTTGNTESVANLIQSSLTDYETTISDVVNASNEMVKEADLVIYGSSTWGYGELQDDFFEYHDKKMTSELLSGKEVAVFGCGDQDSFGDVFCHATDLIREKVERCGGVLVCENLKISGDPSDSLDAITRFAQQF